MKITTTHNRLQERDFPIDELQSINPNIEITINPIGHFDQEIIIELDNNSKQDDNSVAFDIGQLVGIIKANKIK